jgi:hypothetical protein
LRKKTRKSQQAEKHACCPGQGVETAEGSDPPQFYVFPDPPPLSFANNFFYVDAFLSKRKGLFPDSP